MSDTPCVDGCGQDAATIERLRERLAVVEALAEKWMQPNFASFLTGVQAAGAIRAALSPAMAPRSDPGRDQASAPTEAATGSQAGAQQGWGPDARP